MKNSDILFLDIETVPQVQHYQELALPLRNEWSRKCAMLNKSLAAEPEELYKRAGIYAEFGKVICVSCAYEDQGDIKIISFSGHNERRLLNDLSAMIDEFFRYGNKKLCAHNGKEFDFPFLGRRYLINGLDLPEPLRIAGKKPWEICHLDTMELWKFGDYKNYTSLSLLASVFGIPSPKNGIDGSMVADVYWKEGDLDRIVRYCEEDVRTVALLYKRLRGAREMMI